MSFYQRLWLILASCFGLGFLPAPGSIGSLFGAGVSWLVLPYIHSTSARILFVFFVIIFSQVVIMKAEKFWSKDDQRIVIDELAAMCLLSSYYWSNTQLIFLSFVFFRIFDIWKPYPISVIDTKWESSWSSLSDDLLAAIFSIVIIDIFVKISL